MFELEDTTYLGKAVPSQGGGTAINNKDVTVVPAPIAQTLTVPSEYTGYGTISVDAVTSDIDENIQADNIKSGVTILGVEGTLQGTDTYEALITLTGVVDGLPQDTESEDIEDTLTILSGV